MRSLLFVSILFECWVVSSQAINSKSPLFHDFNIRRQSGLENLAALATLLLLDIIHVGVTKQCEESKERKHVTI